MANLESVSESKKTESGIGAITDEEKQTIANISYMLKNHDTNNAIKLIRQLIMSSKNGELVRQYSQLLIKITTATKPPPQPKEEQQFEITVEKPTITFKNVMGMRTLKKKLSKEIMLMNLSRKAYLKHHLKPSGILLYGAPGTGKTFLIEALAGEFKMNIIKPDLASLFSQWVGETEKNIAKMVMLAAQNQPCIIFIDEVDSKIRNRANIEARGESAVNLGATTQFLETMQKVHNEDNKIIFTAASNRVWDVDTAAKRPGRFGDLVYVPTPSLKDRFILFVRYLKTVDNKYISPLGYLRLALATARYSPADIEEICIKAKKDMLYKNITGSQREYFDKKFTKKQYITAKMEDTLPKKPTERISTRDIIKVIRKDFTHSSLDAWYIESRKALIGWEEIQIRKQKTFIFTKSLKEKIRHEGAITKDEQKIYKAMLKDIKKANRWWVYTWTVRQLARWTT